MCNSHLISSKYNYYSCWIVVPTRLPVSWGQWHICLTQCFQHWYGDCHQVGTWQALTKWFLFWWRHCSKCWHGQGEGDRVRRIISFWWNCGSDEGSWRGYIMTGKGKCLLIAPWTGWKARDWTKGLRRNQ
jgi:hypothetical protein